MLMFIGTTEMVLIVIALLLLFGGAKLPQLMRGAGRGIREFKDAMNGTSKDDDEPKKEDKDQTKE